MIVLIRLLCVVTLALLASQSWRLAVAPQGDNYQYAIEMDLRIGKTLRTVQTAFDDAGNLVRQAPGAAKNNLFDVK